MSELTEQDLNGRLIRDFALIIAARNTTLPAGIQWPPAEKNPNESE